MRRLFRAVYTGTRPGLTPAIWAGKGWRGRRATGISCIVMVHRQRFPMYTQVRTTTTTTTTRLRQVCDLLFLCCKFMAELSGQPSGAARRRRERRLRSMLRHEQQTVRMALAAALHHSAGPLEKVENGAPRGQKIAARAGEELEHATHAGLRAQKSPPPGVRPGILPELGPCGASQGRPPDPWPARTPLPRSRCAGGLEEVGGLGKGQGEGEVGGEGEEAGEGEGEDCCERGEDAEAERSCPAGPAAHSG